MQACAAGHVYPPARGGRHERPCRRRPGRSLKRPPAITVPAEDSRGAGDEGALAVDIERHREDGSNEHALSLENPIPAPVSRARESGVRRQQEMMRVDRADAHRERSAHEACRVDGQPRGTGVASPEQATPRAGVVSDALAAHASDQQQEDQDAEWGARRGSRHERNSAPGARRAGELQALAPEPYATVRRYGEVGSC